MKKIFLFPFVFLSVLFFGSLSNPQSSPPDCTTFHLEKCTSYGFPYKYSSQSKSARLKKGEGGQLKIMVLKGNEYHISVCSAPEMGQVKLRVRNYSAEKELLYDATMKDDDWNNLTFIATETRMLFVDVNTVVEGSSGQDIYGCVGVHIEYKPAVYNKTN